MVEHKMTHPILSWLTIIVVAVGTAVWGIIVYHAIDDTDRHFDVGQLPDTPAKSIYSTVTPERPNEQVRQLPTVPATQEAKP